VTLISGGVALIICPIVSVITKDNETGNLDFQLASSGAQPADADQHISLMASMGTWVLGVGFLVFLAGILMGSQSAPYASTVAIVGMLIYFAGGALRAKVV
jgi:hypothetical protein